MGLLLSLPAKAIKLVPLIYFIEPSLRNSTLPRSAELTMVDLDETARAISSTNPAPHRTSENLSVKRFSEKDSV